MVYPNAISQESSIPSTAIVYHYPSNESLTQASRLSSCVRLCSLSALPPTAPTIIGDLQRLIKLSHIRGGIDLLRDEQRKLRPGQWRLNRRQETNFQHKYFFYLLIYWYCHNNSNSTTVQLTIFRKLLFHANVSFRSIIPLCCWKMLQYEHFTISLAAAKSTGLNPLKSNRACLKRNYAVLFFASLDVRQM